MTVSRRAVTRLSVALALFASAVCVIGTMQAHAQDAAAATTVPLAPWVADFKPIIDMVVTSLVGAMVTWVVILYQRWTGRKIQESYVNSIKSAAQTEAGAAVARAEDNLAGRAIHVGSPIVAQAVANIQTRIPGILNAAGATPEALSAIVVGEIGKLQAAAGSTATAVAVTPQGTDASQAPSGSIVDTHLGNV